MKWKKIQFHLKSIEYATGLEYESLNTPQPQILTKDDNDYDRTIAAERYINFQVESLTSSAGLGIVEVVNITNYGFAYTPLGNYTWEDPYSSIKITFACILIF